MSRIFLLLILAVSVTDSFSQVVKQVSVSVFKESTAFPFTRFFPIHPGGEIGITLVEKTREKSTVNWNLAIGGFHHKNIANAFYLRGEYAWRPIVKSTVTIDFMGNLGYMHTFYPGEVYELNSKNGEFEKIDQIGRPHAIAGVGLGITYIRGKRMHPFLRQEIAVESPFANGIPVMIHSFLKFGVSFQLHKNQS